LYDQAEQSWCFLEHDNLEEAHPLRLLLAMVASA